MPTRSSAAVETRHNALQGLLESFKVGDAFTFEQIRKKLPNQNLNVVDTTMKGILKKVRQSMIDANSGLSLEISDDSVRLIEFKEETLFDQNLKTNVPQKRAIAAALWHWLFDFQPDQRPEYTESWRDPLREHNVTDPLEQKRNILRNRLNPALVVDAGSTTTIAMERFLRAAKKVPFQVKAHTVKTIIGEDENGKPTEEDKYFW